MEGLLFFRVYPSDGFRFILIPDGNPSHEFPVLDGNPSSNDCVKSASQGKWKMNTTLPIRVKLTSTKVTLL
jgi:hypothetical protein